MTSELPPPSGPPRAAPAAPAAPPQPAGPPTATLLPPPPIGEPLPAGEPGQPGQPGQPLPVATGRNGLAVAALCCGIAAFIPLVGVLAVIFGIIALNQLRPGLQRGRGLAVAGIVLGALGSLVWGALFVVAVISGAADERQPSAAGPASATAGTAQVFVEKLKAGDCFSGGRSDQIDLVTVIPCTSPHESQVVTVVELPDEPYPGESAVTSKSEQACTDQADPLVTDRAFADLEPSYIYPDADTWRGDRSVLCLVEAPSGTTTGTALKK